MFFFLMIRRPPRSTLDRSSAASDVYKRQLRIASEGARAGCHEALFTLGEAPEERYEVARNWLRSNGYDSTVHLLHAMADLVLTETGLLPHAHARALSEEELPLLAAVAPSQGMMVETPRDAPTGHRG